MTNALSGYKRYLELGDKAKDTGWCGIGKKVSVHAFAEAKIIEMTKGK